MNTTDSKCPWVKQSIPAGGTTLYRMGKLLLAIKREPKQWLVAHKYIEEFEDETLSEEWPQDSSWTRHVFSATHDTLELRPALPDRSVVSRPKNAFYLQPMEQASIFISTPLWVQLYVHGDETKLSEVSTQRLSDTWFGPNTLSGELCYATETHARIALEELSILPHKAITEVRLENQTSSPLLVERINLPAPFLKLYRDVTGDFRTESLSVKRTEDGVMNDTQTSSLDTEHMELISEPRKSIKSDLLGDILDTLFD